MIQWTFNDLLAIDDFFPGNHYNQIENEKIVIAAVAILLMSGAAFAQDDIKKADKMARKEMKKEAKAMKKEGKREGNSMKADSGKAMKHMHKSMKNN